MNVQIMRKHAVRPTAINSRHGGSVSPIRLLSLIRVRSLAAFAASYAHQRHGVIQEVMNSRTGSAL